jgi:DNA primase large subunit
MYNLFTLAKYPFLDDAKSYVKDEKVTVKELLDDSLYERSRAIALERLDNSFERKDVGVRSLASESDCMMELFSYPVARMITTCVNDQYFTKRYALGEAVHMYKLLLKEPLIFLLEISKEFNFDIDFNEEENKLRIYFIHYLKYAPTRYKTWKMINREMSNGYVTINHKGLARLLQEALRERINNELLGKSCQERVKHVFSVDIQRLRNQVTAHLKKLEVEPVGKLELNLLPPCLKKILASIQAGENVPHMGRFALVAFFNSLKLNVNEIIKVFSTAPDFEEDKSRYQIEHITGGTGSTSYKSPGCDKMRTYGLCPSDELDEICRQINHPASYYKKQWKKNKKDAK